MNHIKPLAGPELKPWRDYQGAPPLIQQIQSGDLHGYREMHTPLAYTAKGVLFRYYNHEIWAPVSTIRQDQHGKYHVTQWAVESAKDTTGLSKHKRSNAHILSNQKALS